MIGQIQQAPVLITVGPEMPPHRFSGRLMFSKTQQNNCRLLYNARVYLVRQTLWHFIIECWSRVLNLARVKSEQTFSLRLKDINPRISVV